MRCNTGGLWNRIRLFQEPPGANPGHITSPPVRFVMIDQSPRTSRSAAGSGTAAALPTGVSPPRAKQWALPAGAKQEAFQAVAKDGEVGIDAA